MGKKSRRRTTAHNKQRAQARDKMREEHVKTSSSSPTEERVFGIVSKHCSVIENIRKECDNGEDKLAELFDFAAPAYDVARLHHLHDFVKYCTYQFEFILKKISLSTGGYRDMAPHLYLERLVKGKLAAADSQIHRINISHNVAFFHHCKSGQMGPGAFTKIAQQKPNETFTTKEITLARKKFMGVAEGRLRWHRVKLLFHPTPGYYAKQVTKEMQASVALDMAKVFENTPEETVKNRDLWGWSTAVAAREVDVCISNHFRDDHFLNHRS
jgi:hypothetical protein